jgi:alkanesulfonate monooxygenase SsuD/methylene tetrahydromethanopterin reductase-like flavin-dependent oxidoreductase (luciferase family)
MRIGMFTAAQWSPEEEPGAFLRALREQVRAARDNGFASVLVGQHLLTGPVGMFQPHPLLGQLQTTPPACRSARASCCWA